MGEGAHVGVRPCGGPHAVGDEQRHQVAAECVSLRVLHGQALSVPWRNAANPGAQRRDRRAEGSSSIAAPLMKVTLGADPYSPALRVTLRFAPIRSPGSRMGCRELAR